MIKVARYGPWAVGLLALFLAVMTARASCSNRDWIPYLGKWTGGFVVSSGKDPRRDSLSGYVMIYAMAQSFKMHLEGPQEIIDVEGKWTRRGRRLTLTTTGVKIDDEGGEAARNPSLPFMPATDIRIAYAHSLVLDLSRDSRRLVGLPMSMGAEIGRHEFARD